MKPLDLILRFCQINLVIGLCFVNTLFSQPSNTGPVHQSIPSLSFGLNGSAQIPQAERERILKELVEALKRVNYETREASEPSFFDDVVDFGGSVLNKVTDKVIDVLPVAGVKGMLISGALSTLKDYAVDYISDDDHDTYIQTRDFSFRQEIEKGMAAGVIGCTGDIACIDRFANDLANDPDLQRQFEESGDLGIFDHAHTRALINASKDEAVAQYTGTVIKIDNLDIKVTSLVSDVKNTMIAGFKQINNDQRTIIKGVATLIHIEQKQAIALQNIQVTLNENFKQIGIGIQNITELQQINLFISGVTLEAVGIIDQKVDVLNENITVVSKQINNLTTAFVDMRIEQRNEKIKEIFNNSPLSLKINALLDVNSSISKLILNQEDGEKKRRELIANFKALKTKEDVIIATKMINTWGNVAKEALSVFCNDCPEELSQGINAVMTASNIVGNIASGNFAGAIMNVLGIFKKPEPSPELKMLQQVSRQLNQLERNMNQQFQEVHKHLFAIEENLGTRMQIIDIKLDQLTQFVVESHIQVMEQLGGIDSKLNYVINQNECTKDLVLTLTQQGGQDLCKTPVAEFKNRVFNAQVRNFQDLDNFFRGNFCQPCIKALFDASSVSLVDNVSFRYAQCNIEGINNKARPDKAYEFIFQNFIKEKTGDSIFVNSLLLMPADVTVAVGFPDSIRKMLIKSVLDLNGEDRNFRNHRIITAYVDYLLTMFTMIEFFDNNRLLTPAEISQNPGFSRERARKMILLLEDARDLINHSMFQQSVLAGNGMFAKLDQLIKNGSKVVPNTEGADFNMADIFLYNPYLSKNYAAYLVDKYIGLDRLKDMIDNNRLKKGKQRILINGVNILLFDDKDNKPEFLINLTNLSDPDKHIPLMQGFLPVIEGKIDEDMYRRNLEFVFPTAYLELQSMRERIIAKLAEMNLIVSPQLDANNAAFSRQDLQRLISASKQ